MFVRLSIATALLAALAAPSLADANLVVSSIPEGAEVLSEGEVLGHTPLNVHISLGAAQEMAVTLSFRMEAYEETTREVTLVDGEIATMRPVRLITHYPFPVGAVPVPDQEAEIMTAGYAVTTPDGTTMVWVPEGPFEAGYPEDYDDTRAQDMNPYRAAEIPGFWIDTHEVTNEQYAVFVRATGHEPPSNWQRDKPPAGREKWPVTYVTLGDADAYARWARKRLPTEDQWAKAARGDSDCRLFPWGNEFESGDANTGTAVGKPTDVGSYERDVSPYGVFDMAGNVREWVHGTWEGHPERLVIRGGSFGLTDASNNPQFAMVPFRGYVTPELVGRYHSVLGFRCVVGE